MNMADQASPQKPLTRVLREQRVPWGPKERAAFIAEWIRRTYPVPAGGWNNYDIHHIRPREFGGTNNFDNLVPVERQTDHRLFNEFWREYEEHNTP